MERRTDRLWFSILAAIFAAIVPMCGIAHAQSTKPNIVVIMGDDIGWFNIGAYHQGMMAGRTPNLDQLAAEGMRFTDYYAEASCTAGRANFITGELPIRTGMTTVGQAGATIGHPRTGGDASPRRSSPWATPPASSARTTSATGTSSYRPSTASTSSTATSTTSMRWRTPVTRTTRRTSATRSGRAILLHSWATDKDDATVDPRWGKIGKQKIEDDGELCPERMETVDDEILAHAMKFLDKSKSDGKPFFLWLNPTRMHIVTHLSDKYEKMRNSENGWSIHEAGMAQLDDIVGDVMKKLKAMGVDDNTIVVFTTDNGTEVFTWPDGGQTPFAQSKGTVMEGGFRVPAIIRWPGKIAAGKVENGLFSGLDWFPTFVAAAGDPNIATELLAGQDPERHELQGASRRLQPDGPPHGQRPVESPRDLLLRRERARRGPHRRLQVPLHRPAQRLAGREDPRRRAIPDQPAPRSVRAHGLAGNGTKDGAQQYFDWFKYEFWRFVFVQQQVAGKLAMTAVEFPPMQAGASFNLDAVKAKIEAARAAIAK